MWLFPMFGNSSHGASDVIFCGDRFLSNRCALPCLLPLCRGISLSLSLTFTNPISLCASIPQGWQI